MREEIKKTVAFLCVVCLVISGEGRLGLTALANVIHPMPSVYAVDGTDSESRETADAAYSAKQNSDSDYSADSEEQNSASSTYSADSAGQDAGSIAGSAESDTDSAVHAEDRAAYAEDRAAYAEDRAAYVEDSTADAAGSVDFAADAVGSVDVAAADVESVDVAAADAETVLSESVLTTEWDIYRVKVSYGKESGIPDDARLVVREITDKNDPNYADYIAAGADTAGVDVGSAGIAKAFDISLRSDETGVEYQPSRDMKVEISIPSYYIKEDMEISVVHFAEKISDELSAELSGGYAAGAADEQGTRIGEAISAVLDSVPLLMEVDLTDNTAAFTTDGFSVFVVFSVVKEQVIKASDGNNYKVTVEYDTASGISADAVLSVAELTEGNPYFNEYVSMNNEILGKDEGDLVFAHVFDISLVNPETGERYKPNENVKVSVKLLGETIEEGDRVSVVHFKDTSTGNSSSEETAAGKKIVESAETEVVEASVIDGAVEFMTDGFSVYVLSSYTVDFEWNGHLFSMEGGGTLKLSTLLEALGYTEHTADEAMNITFTNPAYVAVEQTEDDWLLRSLTPFTSRETLDVYFGEGEEEEILSVSVTDAQNVCKIVRTGTQYSSIQRAYDAAHDGDVIQMLDNVTSYTLPGEVKLDRSISVTIRSGAKRCTITRGSSIWSLKYGNRSIFRMFEMTAGSVTLENIIIDGRHDGKEVVFNDLGIGTSGSIFLMTADNSLLSRLFSGNDSSDDPVRLTLNSGAELRYGYSHDNGGAINVEAGLLTMNPGSSIHDCIARYKNRDAARNGGGGAVCVWPQESRLGRLDPINTKILEQARFVMNGGEISDCMAMGGEGTLINIVNRSVGGGVFLNCGGFFEMNGGAIRRCSAFHSDDLLGDHMFAGGGVAVGDDARDDSEIIGLISYQKSMPYDIYKGKGIVRRVADLIGGDLSRVLPTQHVVAFVMNGGIIEECEAPHGGGGGIAVDHNDLAVINNGIIRNCKGKHGSGIEVMGDLVMNGGTVTGCEASDDNGGAIRFFDPGENMDKGAIYFSGDVRIFGNYDSGKSAEDIYVAGPASLLNFGSWKDYKINLGTDKDQGHLKGNLLTDTAIIYVYDDNPGPGTRFGEHYNKLLENENEANGTDEPANATPNLYSRFKNDLKPLELKGAHKASNEDLVWASLNTPDNKASYVCKVVMPHSYMIPGTDDGSGNPETCTYYTEYPFESLKDAQGFIDMYMGGRGKIQMLRDYEVPASDVLTISSTESITVTTADKKQDADLHGGHTYYKGNVDTATIKRADGNTESLFTVNGGSLTLDSVTLDGGSKEGRQAAGNGGLVNFNAGSLAMSEGTTLQNSKAEGNGGAVYTANGLTVNMNGSMIKNCEAVLGSAVYVGDGATLNINGGAVTGCRATGSNGGAVNVGSAASRLVFSGIPTVSGNTNNDSYASNVVLDKDSNEVIRANGVSGGEIGVFIPEGADLYDKHGKAAQQFGEYSGTNIHEAFINDRNGLSGADGGSGRLIWEDDFALVRIFVHKIWAVGTPKAQMDQDIPFTVYAVPKKANGDADVEHKEAIAAYDRSDFSTANAVSELPKGGMPYYEYTAKEAYNNTTTYNTVRVSSNDIEDDSLYENGVLKVPAKWVYELWVPNKLNESDDIHHYDVEEGDLKVVIPDSDPKIYGEAGEWEKPNIEQQPDVEDWVMSAPPVVQHVEDTNGSNTAYLVFRARRNNWVILGYNISVGNLALDQITVKYQKVGDASKKYTNTVVFDNEYDRELHLTGYREKGSYTDIETGYWYYIRLDDVKEAAGDVRITEITGNIHYFDHTIINHWREDLVSSSFFEEAYITSTVPSSSSRTYTFIEYAASANEQELVLAHDAQYSSAAYPLLAITNTFTPNKVLTVKTGFEDEASLDKAALDKITKVKYEVKDADGKVIDTPEVIRNSDGTWPELKVYAGDGYTVRQEYYVVNGGSGNETVVRADGDGSYTPFDPKYQYAGAAGWTDGGNITLAESDIASDTMVTFRNIRKTDVKVKAAWDTAPSSGVINSGIKYQFCYDDELIVTQDPDKYTVKKNANDPYNDTDFLWTDSDHESNGKKFAEYTVTGTPIRCVPVDLPDEVRSNYTTLVTQEEDTSHFTIENHAKKAAITVVKEWDGLSQWKDSPVLTEEQLNAITVTVKIYRMDGENPDPGHDTVVDTLTLRHSVDPAVPSWTGKTENLRLGTTYYIAETDMAGLPSPYTDTQFGQKYEVMDLHAVIDENIPENSYTPHYAAGFTVTDLHEEGAAFIVTNTFNAIARVKVGEGDWIYYDYLVNTVVGGEILPGAFDAANAGANSGKTAVIELLKQGEHEEDGVIVDDTKFPGDTQGRYTLTNGYEFNNNANITLRTMPGRDYPGTITRARTQSTMVPLISFGSGTHTVEQVALDGSTVPVTGSDSIVHIADGGTLNLTDAELKNGKTDGAHGALGFGSGVTLNLSGGTRITGNTDAGGEARNIYLDKNSDTVINTTDAGLNARAEIGVYAADTEPYNNHGKAGQSFGTATGSGYSELNLEGFKNDRNPLLFGVSAEDVGRTGHKIYWERYICKIVDENGKEWPFITLNKALDHSRINPSDYISQADGAPGVCTIEMLVDYVIPNTDKVELNNGENITLTTAAVSGDDVQYKFVDTVHADEDDPDGDTAIITRGYDGASLFTNNGIFTLANIILDGGAVNTNGLWSGRKATGSNVKGGLIGNNAPEASLTVKSMGILRNSVTESLYGGGAVWVRKGSDLTMSGTITNCSASNGGGGAIKADEANDTGSGNIIINASGMINSCTANTNGGAIYMCNGYLNVGSIEINDCRAARYGGAIYLAAGGTAGESGMVINGHSTTALYSEGDVVDGETLTEERADELNKQSAINAPANAVNGGGIYVASGASFTFTGGEIERCKAAAVNGTGGFGGAIFNAGTVTMTEKPETPDTHVLTNGSIEYCSAVKGGAIYNEGGKAAVTDKQGNVTVPAVFGVTMTGGYLEHCMATEGGAIYNTGWVNLSTESNKPGIINDCSAEYGGGLFVRSGELDMTHGSIRNCSAKYGGGLYNMSIVHLTGESEQDNIDHCYAANNGGGIYVHGQGSMVITGGYIKDCSAGKFGGAIYDDATDSGRQYEFLATNLTIQGHSGRADGLPGSVPNAQKGGGIYMADGTMKLEGCFIYDCTAVILNGQGSVIGGYGGAIYQVYDRTIVGPYADSSGKLLLLSNVTIDGHKDLDSETNIVNAYQGGAIYIFNGLNTTSNADSGFIDLKTNKPMTLRELAKKAGPKLEISGGSILDCTAAATGGAIYCDSPAISGRPTMQITDSTVINGHESLAPSIWNAQATVGANSGGGAIYYQRGTLKMDGRGSRITVKNCTAAYYGGAIYGLPEGTFVDEEDKLRYTASLMNVDFVGHADGFAPDQANAGLAGGGICMKMGVLNIDNCSFTNFLAPTGAAIFGRTNDGGTSASTITIRDGSVTGNKTTEVYGGAINVPGGKVFNAAGTVAPKIGFGGSVRVEGNTSTQDSVYEHNLVLETEDNQVINTLDCGITTDAHIGVFVVDSRALASGTAKPYDKQGKSGQVFGTWGLNVVTNVNSATLTFNVGEGISDQNLFCFTNDRNGCWGVRDGTKIRWNDTLVKVTDSEDNLLYQLKENNIYFPAVYETLRAGLAAAEGTLYAYSKSGDSVTYSPAAPMSATNQRRLKMLRDYAITGNDYVTLNNTNDNILITTAETTFSAKMRDNGDKLTFAPTFTSSQGRTTVYDAVTGAYKSGDSISTAILARGWTGTSAIGASSTLTALFNLPDKGILTTRDIIFDGKYNQTQYNGRAIANRNGKLTIGGGTQFRNNYWSAAVNGGAVFNRGNDLSVGEAGGNPVIFSNAYAQTDGGAIYADGNYVLTVTNAEFAGCGAGNDGGAIFHNGTSSPSDKLVISDSAFKDCTAKRNGGALYTKVTTTMTNVGIDGHANLGVGTANAAKGSAVYLYAGTLTIKTEDKTVNDGNGGTTTVSGVSEIKNCSASDTEGGAVNVNSAGCRLRFFGRPIIYNNIGTGSLASQQKNVVLNFNSTDIINTIDPGLTGDIAVTTVNEESGDITSVSFTPGAHIGIYVTGSMSPESDPYLSRGGFEDDFGTYENTAGGKANLACFTNDRNGMFGEISKNNYKIRWTRFVCKITREDTKALLYYKVGSTVKGEAVFKTLADAFANLGNLYTDSACTAHWDNVTVSTTVDGQVVPKTRIEMLTNYQLPAGITSNHNAYVTLTTAKLSGLASNDRHPFWGDWTDGTKAPIAMIVRGYDFPANTSMFALDNVSLVNRRRNAYTHMALEQITIDGRRVNSANANASEVLADLVDYRKTGDGGLISVIIGDLYLRQNATLQNGIAAGHGGRGGGVFLDNADYAKFYMYDGLIQNCVAERNIHYAGGGVCVHDGYMEMNGGRIYRCRATDESGTDIVLSNGVAHSNNGGGGGGIAIGHHDTLVMTGGKIEECSAYKSGAGIEIHGDVHMTGGEITGCTSTRGGAVNFYDDNDHTGSGRLYLSGSPKIYDNPNSSTPTGRKNVDIYRYDCQCGAVTLNKITVEGILNDDAIVGVFAPVAQDGLDNVNSEYFGRYTTSPQYNFSGFKNDKTRYLVGVDGGTANGVNRLSWGTIICRIVDQDKAEHVFPTLNAALDHSRISERDYVNGVCTIEMLADYDMQTTGTGADFLSLGSYSVTVNGATKTGLDNIRLTTASTQEADDADTANDWVYHYIGKLDGSKDVSAATGEPRAQITRKDTSDASLITVQNARTELILTDIILDGGNKDAAGRSCTGNGGIVNAAAGTLSLLTGAELRNSTAANGGAVYVSSGAVVTMENGDAAAAGASLSGNAADAAGAGIYLAQGALMNISGSPTFGSGENANTVTIATLAGKTNGGDDSANSYSYPDGAARQDIYLAEAGTENTEDAGYQPSGITITGDITSGDGAIWIWADNEYRYKQLMPFAKLGTGVVYKETPGTGEFSSAHLKAFRNARDDETTENGTDTYLFGSIEGDVPDLVYWTGVSGSRKVILRKADNVYKSIANKEFTIYRGSSETAYTPKGQTQALTGLTTGISGCVYAGILPYGIYILKEKDPARWFYFIIDETGVYGTLFGDGSNERYKVDGYATRAEAQAAAKAKNEKLKMAKKGS